MTASPLRAIGTFGLAAACALIPSTAALACDLPAGEAPPAAAPHATAAQAEAPAEAADLETQLQRARYATARYQDVWLAEADGYTMGESCIPGLGYHFVREVAEDQSQVAITEPNSIVYAPQEDGSLRLVAVGYVSKRPASLFGQDFDPPATLPYYTLHAWIWEENPEGTFEHINPNISCPGRQVPQAPEGEGEGEAPAGV